MHEGKITLTSAEELESWPMADEKVRPEPYVVAYGIDKRNGKRHPLIAVYNGVAGKAGRIVADSSWHHYLNNNLRELAQGAPGDNSVIAQIGQFYVNLALWLAGRENIQKMAHYTFSRLARHPRVREEMSRDMEATDEEVFDIGQVAHNILSREATPCEIHELLQVAVPRGYRQQYETFYFPTTDLAVSPLASQQMLLGAIVRNYAQELSGIIDSDLSPERKVEEMDELPIKGYKQAQAFHVKKLEDNFTQSQDFR
jgi:hypothetical protein